MPKTDLKQAKAKESAEEGEKPVKQSVSLSFNAASLQAKLPLMLLMLVLLGFSFFLFTRANLHVSDLFDVPRFEYSALKIASISFLLFALAFGASIGLAVKTGFGSSKLESLLPFLLSLISAGIGFVLLPAYGLAFVGFALTTGASSFFASFAKEKNFSSAWSIAGKALVVLLLLAFVFTYLRVSSSKDAYLDIFLSGTSEIAKDSVSSIAPVAARQALDLCASTIEKVQVNSQNVKSALSKQDLQKAIESNALVSSLPSGTKSLLVDAYYDAATEQAVTLANRLKDDIAKTMRNANVSSQLRQEDIDKAITPGALKEQLEKIPQAKAVVNALPVIAGLAVVSMLSVIGFFLKIIAACTAWLLGKLGV